MTGVQTCALPISSADMTILNTTTHLGDFPLYGMSVVADENSTVCSNLSGNTTTSALLAEAYHLEQDALAAKDRKSVV